MKPLPVLPLPALPLSEPSLPSPPFSRVPLSAVRTDRRRLLQLRWLSIAVMTLLAGVGLPLLAPGQDLEPLFGIALLLAASNLALHADTLRALTGGRGAFIQLAFDLCAWGAFLYFCGGVTNPASAMLLPLVAAGAAILPPARAWALAALAIALYSLLWQYHLPVPLADEELAMYWHLAGMWLGFAVSAATVVWFVARLNRALAHQQGALAAAQAARARDAYVVGLGKLAAGAAHRLGTPLATLRILADDIARRPGLDAETLDDLALMASQIEHCKAILNSLTQEAGQQRAEEGGAHGVGDWLRAVIARWRQLRPHAEVALDLAPDLAEQRLYADASLAEAVHNLIDNAANAQRASGQGEAVTVTAQRSAGELVIEVADRGPGMSAALRAEAGQAPRPAGTAIRSGGMGIGLMLARSAADHHGGTLGFLPRPGGGTLARLTIPLRNIQP